jgi:RHS repeat-associated protein
VRFASHALKRVLGGFLAGGSALVLLVGADFAAAPPAMAAATAPGGGHSHAAAVVPVSSAANALKAVKAAGRQGSRVEVAGDRTAYSQTFANPNGTMTYVESAQPRWVKRGSAWVAANANLVHGRDGSWSPQAAEAGLTLSGGGHTALATVQSGSYSLGVSWPSALPTPTVSGAVATYPDVFPGVDLVVTAQVTGGFEETLKIKDAAAAADPQLADLNLAVSARGLSQKARPDGSVTFQTARGKQVFFSPPPMTWDSSARGAGVTGPGAGGKASSVNAQYGTRSVRLAMPTGLAKEEFPVFVDPSYSLSPTLTAYGELQSAFPTTSEYNNTFQQLVSVGWDGAGTDRGVYAFGLPPAASGATTNVLSATLSAEAVATFTSASTSHTINLNQIAAYTTATTWNSPPTQVAGPAAQTFTTASTTPNLGVSWNVASWLQADLRGNGSQFAVELVNSNETTQPQLVKFSNNPTLSVTYDHAPLAPTSIALDSQYTTPSGAIYTATLFPGYYATATDSDGDGLTYTFVTNQGGKVVDTATVGPLPSGTRAFYGGPNFALTDRTQYTLTVTASDGTETSAAGTEAFTTDATTPALPTASCTGYPHNAWSSYIAGGTTCTLSDSSPMILGYEYGFQEGNGAVAWNWTYSPTVTINPPGPGLYHLIFSSESDAALGSANVSYDFGVGASGAMLSPADGSQTASAVLLQAGAPAGYTQATFEYREGASGSFLPIPNGVVDADTGTAVNSWPVTAGSADTGVQTDHLTWHAGRTLTDDGPIQIEAVFANGGGGTKTTDPVTVTPSVTGTGTDFATAQAGPLTVGEQTGNAALDATDVSIASYGSSLTVTRTFNSIEPKVQGLFGPGWTSSITGGVTAPWTGLADDGSYVVLTATDGTNDTFTVGATTNGVTSYASTGDAMTAGLALTGNGTTFTLTDSAGTVTTFTRPASGRDYRPQTVTQAGEAGTTGIVYDTTSGDASYGDPLLMVAPDAASTKAPTSACPYPAAAATWTVGCRGLSFTYNPAGNITEVDFVYSDNSGNFHKTPVANYGYDATGRLTSEWDPRLSTPLVTGYTYDESQADSDYGRITQYTPAQAAGSAALAPWTFSYDDNASDANYGSLDSVSRTHDSANGGGTATTTVDYSVPLTTAGGGPMTMDSATLSALGQYDDPVAATATFPASHVPSDPPASGDWQYATIGYYDASGREVNSASYVDGHWAVTMTEYDTSGNVTSTLSAADRAKVVASSDPQNTLYNLQTINYYGCDDFGTINPCGPGNQQHEVLTDSYGPSYTASINGSDETVRSETSYTYDQGAPNGDVNANGGPYELVTAKTVAASIGTGTPNSLGRANARTISYTYANSSTSIGWTLGTPLTTITDPGGLNITSTAVYNTSPSLYNGANLQTASYMPSDTSGGGAGDTETVYYTAGANLLVAACGNKPEWANLTCQVGPAAQPGTSGLPSLPVTTYTYDDYLNQVTKAEAFGSTGTRTTTTGYDSDERPATQTVTGTGTGMGTPVPETRTVYSTGSGVANETDSLDSSGTVTAHTWTNYDDFGQIINYLDGGGAYTTYTYNIGGQVTSRNDGAGTDTITYDSAGNPVQIIDSQAGTFTATYSPDGQLASETYPGAVTGTYTYDPEGTPVEVSYNGPHWTAPLSDAIQPDGAGDWATQSVTDTATPTVSTQSYTYDNADRLTGVQDTEAGQCVTRVYTYDTDSNRTRLARYAPNSDGSCQNSTGTTTTTPYDSADRDTSTGYAYDTQGDITTTPSADAGGSGNLAATYYANNMLASQTQSGSTITYALDPTLARVETYTQSGVTYTNYYADSSNSPFGTWASNNNFQRNVTDFSGNLAAEVTNSGVTLELPDLHGDVLATATPSSTSTGPTGTFIYTEFGAPENGTPGNYGWLGANQISSAALGGQMLMGARAYNTNSGRFSQVDPIPGGSANAFDYAFQNPIMNFDLSGMCSWFSGCAETAIAAGAVAVAACYALRGAPNFCFALGAGAGNLVSYLWGNRHPTWAGAAWSFFSAFATYYASEALFGGLLLVLSRVFRWWGWAAAAGRAAGAGRTLMNIPGGVKLSVRTWFWSIW